MKEYNTVINNCCPQYNYPLTHSVCTACSCTIVTPYWCYFSIYVFSNCLYNQEKESIFNRLYSWCDCTTTSYHMKWLLRDCTSSQLWEFPSTVILNSNIIISQCFCCVSKVIFIYIVVIELCSVVIGTSFIWSNPCRSNIDIATIIFLSIDFPYYTFSVSQLIYLFPITNSTTICFLPLLFTNSIDVITIMTMTFY